MAVVTALRQPDRYWPHGYIKVDLLATSHSSQHPLTSEPDAHLDVAPLWPEGDGYAIWHVVEASGRLPNDPCLPGTAARVVLEPDGHTSPARRFVGREVVNRDLAGERRGHRASGQRSS